MCGPQVQLSILEQETPLLDVNCLADPISVESLLIIGGGKGAHDVSQGAPASADDLQHGVRCGRLALDLNGQDAKQQDLDGGPSCIPTQSIELHHFPCCSHQLLRSYVES